MVLTKIFILLVMLAILYCLGSALYYLARGSNKNLRMVKALSWRVGLSLALFLLLLLGFASGLIAPHGIYT